MFVGECCMLTQKLKQYTEKFNADDQQRYATQICNEDAFAFLRENMPRMECPNQTLEEIYYFRWWVLRKHIKKTEDGYVITEFLPNVPWSGKHNAIAAPFGHQVNETKWLKNARLILRDYINYYLNGIGNLYDYSTWFADSVYEYCRHCNDMAFAVESLPKLQTYFDTLQRQLTEDGLYYSYDGDDAMECSISGGRSIAEAAYPGLRPTMNSYMAANAFAIAKIAEYAEKRELAASYHQKGQLITEKMLALLWDGSFFKAVHSTDRKTYPKLCELAPERNARELLGYIPWMFNLPPAGYEKAFEDLLCPEGFATENGLTTAEQRHPRFMFDYPHSCLWNGYIWPFATTQTLVAVMNLLENYEQSILNWEHFYDMLLTYAKMHYHTLPNGKRICWIDETQNPITGQWSSRQVLESWNWPERKGGIERGRDYNHSGFCDLMLRGVLGIRVHQGKLKITPHIPADWDYFMVENLWIDGECYRICYDRTGRRYGSVGLVITKSTEI